MRTNGRKLVSLLAVGVAGIIASGGATASAATSQIRVGSTAPLPLDAKVAGSAPSATRLALTVELQPQDAFGLQTFATAVSTPGNPLYGHYLSVGQFAARFGATPAHVAAVEAALRSEGLDVGTPTANDLTIPVTGTAAQVEQAMSVSLAKVTLPGGQTAYTNEQAPALPSTVAPYVEGVIGLSNAVPDQPAGLIRRTGKPAAADALRFARALRAQVPTNGGPQPCSTAQAQQPNGGLTADEVATAYQFAGMYGAGDFGQGQTIAMFEQQPFNPTDIAEYQACYGTSATVTPINVQGGPGPYAPPPGGSGDGESALDIEQAIGLAPKANVLVYQGPETATVAILSTIVSQDQAKVISSSYGVCEALTGGTTVGAENPILQEAAAQGQSFFISSGDSGSNMCFQADQSNTSLSVIDPGGQPFATGVGGTTLFADQNGSPAFYQPGDTPVEAVWNDGFDGSRASGSGGGISSSFTMPVYQSGAPASLGVLSNASAAPCGGSTFCREVPDVSADADPNTGYVVFSDSNWGITGGTSAAAPLWAAFTALANSSSACRGLSVGFVNPALYQVAGSSYLNNFTDVKTASPITGEANNDALFQFTISGNPNDLYPVGTGYDMATGLGSMIAPALANSLCSLRAPAYSVSLASPGAQQTVTGQGVGLQMHGSDSGGAGLTFSATGLPAGLGISASGLISGTTTTAQSTTVTVTATDGFANAGSVQFAWTVVSPRPPFSSAKSSGLGSKPKLSFTLGSGAFSPALRSVTISLPKGLSFSGKSKNLKQGIVVKSGGKRITISIKGHGSTVTITFSSPITSASVTVGSPAITITSGEANKIRRHKVKRLAVALRATNTSGGSTALGISWS